MAKRKTSCKGKIKHDTAEVAKRVAKYRTTTLGTVFSYYMCSQCGKYHVGTSPIQKGSRL